MPLELTRDRISIRPSPTLSALGNLVSPKDSMISDVSVEGNKASVVLAPVTSGLYKRTDSSIRLHSKDLETTPIRIDHIEQRNAGNFLIVYQADPNFRVCFPFQTYHPLALVSEIFKTPSTHTVKKLEAAGISPIPETAETTLTYSSPLGMWQGLPRDLFESLAHSQLRRWSTELNWHPARGDNPSKIDTTNDIEQYLVKKGLARTVTSESNDRRRHHKDRQIYLKVDMSHQTLAIFEAAMREIVERPDSSYGLDTRHGKASLSFSGPASIQSLSEIAEAYHPFIESTTIVTPYFRIEGKGKGNTSTLFVEGDLEAAVKLETALPYEKNLTPRMYTQSEQGHNRKIVPFEGVPVK